MERNPEATCGNCQYGLKDEGTKEDLYCRKYPKAVFKLESQWCGCHPEFWKGEPFREWWQTPVPIQELTTEQPSSSVHDEPGPGDDS